MLLAGPVVVRIGFSGRGVQPNLHLNSKLVSWENLDNALKESLELRPDWVVYVDADPEVDWQCVTDVMDIIRNAHAQVVLVTTLNSQ